ncbi:MAG: type III-B CRISPR module-associated protein Cmr5 [Candidatus Micrarchaeota archaeon]|nr:type III-B CRISPR module-associated protein Cmr5 [Candidatus Micrarchaeota archaeon]
MAKTLQQKRAKYAFDIVEQIKNKSYAFDFSGLVAKMPSYILTNGLGNTIAFLWSKQKEHHLIVAGVMADWILRKTKLNTSEKIGKLRDNCFLNTNEIKNSMDEILHKLVLDVTMHHYMVITNELLSLFTWLNRFCNGMIEKGGE